MLDHAVAHDGGDGCVGPARLAEVRERCRRHVELRDGTGRVSGGVDGGSSPMGAAAALLAFEAAVEGLESSGVWADADDLARMHMLMDRVAAVVDEAEVRFDRHELWKIDGGSSLRRWFMDRVGLGSKEASSAARRVERLESWPEVAEAWRDHRLSGAQVDAIVAGVPSRFVAEFAEQAAAVVDVVAPLDAIDTAVAITRWVRCAEAADGPGQLHERASGVFVDRMFDGRMSLGANLSALEASYVVAALEQFAVPDAHDADGAPIGEPRSAAQRRADALVGVCRFALGHRSCGSSRTVGEVSLIVDLGELHAAALRGLGVSDRAGVEALAAARGLGAVERAWLVDGLDRFGDGVTSEGMEVDASAIGALCCDSVVRRILTAGGEVLDVGRRSRTATPAQRRAIIARDQHCRAPGCRTSARHCEVHHVDPWALGGRTDVDRMVLLCGSHHRRFHEPGHHMELGRGAVFTVQLPSGRTASSRPACGVPPAFGRGSW